MLGAKPMVAKKSILFIAVVLAGLASSYSCFAEVKRPEAYEKLTAVELEPGQAPRFVHGISDLAKLEKRHRERLPMQLEGATKRIKKKKYTPSASARSEADSL